MDHQGRNSQHQSSGNHPGQSQQRSSSQQRGRRHGMRQSPVQELVNHASRRLAHLSTAGLLFLAILGGGLITIGTLFGAMLAHTATSFVLQSVLLSLGIATSLFIVVGLNVVLFTEPNIIVPANLYNTTVKQGFGRLLWFWLLAYVGNFLGAIAFAWLIKFSHALSPESVSFIKDTMMTRLTQSPMGGELGFFNLFISAVLANWVLGFAMMYSVYNRAAIGKIFIFIVAVSMVVTSNLQFSPFNMSYFAILKTMADGPGWFQLIANNIVPVSIGNLFGGAFLVSLPLLIQAKRRTQRAKNG